MRGFVVFEGERKKESHKGHETDCWDLLARVCIPAHKYRGLLLHSGSAINGRAASAGVALEPPRATRSQPEFIRIYENKWPVAARWTTVTDYRPHWVKRLSGCISWSSMPHGHQNVTFGGLHFVCSFAGIRVNLGTPRAFSITTTLAQTASNRET